MILILDQEKNVVRSVSVESPQGMVFYNDTHTEKVVDFDSTFEFDVPIDDSDDSKYFQAGNYVLLQDLDDDSILFKMTEPQDVRDDSSSTPYKHIFAENVFIYDLNNVIVRDRTFTDTTIEPVLNYILAGSGWAVDDVENVGLVDGVEFSGYTTAQEALHQVCEAFDCEVKFYVKTYQGRIVDYRCKVAAEFGENEGVRIENGTGIKGITRKQVITDVKTALIPLGATQDDGNPLTISSVNNGLDYVFDDDANDLYNPSGNGYLMTVATNEKITNANALKDWGKAELKKINSPKYQYEVDVLMLEQVYGFEAHRIRKGSHVRVVDHEMNPPVTVDARVIELNISYSDMAKSTCVIGDFIEVNSATPAIINQLRQNQQVATDAKKTAVIAGGDAAEASQKADAASQDATDAKQKADNAKQSADQAQETANQANNAANQANTAAQNALTSANGKNKNYYGIMVPVDPQEGDRWFKSVNGEEVQTFIYSSESWTPITLAPENLGTIYAEDGVIGSLDAGKITVGKIEGNQIATNAITADKINVTSLSAISSNLGKATAGSIDIGNGTFKVDTKGNMTASNATLTDGSLTIDYEVVAVAPNVKATGTMKVQKGAFVTDDTFTQGGNVYTRSIQINGNGLLTSIRTGNAAAATISIDPMSGISMNGANQNLQIGNLQLNNAHSIGMADSQKLYFNQGIGGSPRIDIACKSVDANSLRSLKENFTEVDPEEALEEILKTDVVEYNFKDDEDNEKHTTLIIDDMPEEDKHYYTPEAFLASGGEGRDDGSIIGYLMLSIKKLKQEIDELRAKFN
ncbi:hypothetical protein AK02_14130 [Listeria monocytogenes]|nr:hypothetical protein [Listeria monocytogenes]EIW0169164.1 phage tail protein [Listeria monocytogenes]